MSIQPSPFWAQETDGLACACIAKVPTTDGRIVFSIHLNFHKSSVYSEAAF